MEKRRGKKGQVYQSKQTENGKQKRLEETRISIKTNRKWKKEEVRRDKNNNQNKQKMEKRSSEKRQEHQSKQTSIIRANCTKGCVCSTQGFSQFEVFTSSYRNGIEITLTPT